MEKAEGSRGQGRPKLGGGETPPPKSGVPYANLGIDKDTAKEFRAAHAGTWLLVFGLLCAAAAAAIVVWLIVKRARREGRW